MPGTIQVSVLEFKGLPLASPASLFLKVALGKREYQTSDVGDFSFPLTTLRDNLVFSLQDAEGNEIAHTDIQTKLIVEKVSWDDIFHLDGGGQVHMKLQFILSEEEQNRIRSMREAAMKKKLGNIPNISPRYSEIASPVGDPVMSSPQAQQIGSDSQTRTVLRVVSLEDVASQASSLSNSDIFSEGSQSNYGTREGVLKQEIPKAMDEKERACSTPRVQGIAVHFPQGHESAHAKKLQIPSSVPNDQTEPVSNQENSPKLEYSRSDVTEKSTSVSAKGEDDHVDKSEQQPPLDKTPSNVRKLVSSFESSLAQEVKSPLKLSPVKPGQKKVGEGGRLKDFDPKHATEPAEPSSGRHENPIVTGAFKTASKSGENIGSDRSFAGNMLSETINRLKQSTSAPMESKTRELSTRGWNKSSGDLERPSATETAAVSGKKLDDHSGRVYSFSLSAEQQDSSSSSYAEESLNKDSTEIIIQVAPSEKSKSLEHREEELFHLEKSSMWIFPNDRKNLCITTAGKGVINLLGSSHAEARSHQKKKSSSVPRHSEKRGTENEKDHKNSRNPRKSRSESSSDDASGGLVAQVIKIGMIVGFGLLVLVTRQREPRKHKRETNDLLFKATGYLDEQILTEREDGPPAES